MNLSEIENLSGAELKAKRNELVTAIWDEKPTDLAERYVQARTDATLRDEKLGQQGKTIALLQKALEEANADKAALTATVNTLDAAVKQLQKDIENQASSFATAKAEGEATLAERDATIAALTSERNAAITLAKARRVALASIAGIINPLLADEG